MQDLHVAALGPLVAIVPATPFGEAKLRLAQVLGPEARQALSRRMLEHTLGVLARAHGIDQIAVVSRDEEALKIAREGNVWAIKETRSGLNDGLEQATAIAQAQGMCALLIVPADLPKLEPRDVEQMIELCRTRPGVVVAPAQRDAGTNALLVNPIGLIKYAFGDLSSIEHRRRAEQAGAHVEIYRSATIAFDLDVPEDARILGYAIQSDGSFGEPGSATRWR